MDAHDRNEPEISETSRGPAFTRRSFLAGAASVPLSLLLANRLPALAGGVVPTLTGTQAACALPKEVLTRIERGYRADRCGQIMVVPRGFNYVSGGISHSTPWGYTQDVPMFLYGPGVIRAQERQPGPVGPGMPEGVVHVVVPRTDTLVPEPPQQPDVLVVADVRQVPHQR